MRASFPIRARSTRRRPARTVVAGLAALLAAPGPAADDPPDLARMLAGHYRTAEPAPDPAGVHDLADGYRVQRQFVEALSADLGPRVGYKIGLTSDTAQRELGVRHPVYGTLHGAMLRDNGAVVPAGFGARPLVEADLLVRIADDAINTAATDRDLVGAIDAVIPFIELPDLVYRSGVDVDAPRLVAVNVGARLGVTGPEVRVGEPADWIERLRRFEVRLLDGAGRELARGRGGDLLGGPLDVLRWLRAALRDDGRRLERGDLVSLGSLTAPRPVEPGSVRRARYHGLAAHPVEVSVRFAPVSRPNRSIDNAENAEAQSTQRRNR